MAPRANWKGFLRLSLVTCPVALYPATSDTEKVSFNQINRKTGHRIKYAKVDAETGEEVASDDIMKGYKVDTDTYIEVSKEELDDIALESTRTIEIDEFVPKTEPQRSDRNDTSRIPATAIPPRPRIATGEINCRTHPLGEAGFEDSDTRHKPRGLQASLDRRSGTEEHEPEDAEDQYRKAG